jgi:hypothetical protein
MNTPEAEFDTINRDNAIASGDVSVAIGSSLEPADVLERVRRGELI